jgi:hypothetical protein
MSLFTLRFISHPHQLEHNLEDYDGKRWMFSRRHFSGQHRRDQMITLQLSGVELLVKGDGRAYTFNIKTDSVIPDDMYQYPFCLPAGSWNTLRLSWPGFIRTRRGKELANQHQLDPSNIVRSERPPLPCCIPLFYHMCSYGISVVDRGEGPFEVLLQQLQGYRQLASRGIAVAASHDASDTVQPVK